MNKQQKKLIINLMHEKFLDNQASFLVGYKGLTVDQMQKLRKELRLKGGQFKVAKNRLVKRALDQIEGEGINQFSSYLKDQIGVVFALNEPSSVAKMLYDFSKENDSLKLIVGQFESRLFDREGVIRLASLPTKQVLLANLLGTVRSPLVNFNSAMYSMLLRMVLLLKALADKKVKQ